MAAGFLALALVSGLLVWRGGSEAATPAASRSVASPNIPSTTLSPSPATAPGTTTGSGSYRFLHVVFGARPVRWASCEIRYRLFVREAPAGYAEDVEEAFRRLASATGFDFVRAGVTGEDPAPAVLRISRRGRTEGADIDVLWQDHEGFEATKDALDMKRNVIAWASPFPESAGLFASYESAIVVLDAEQTGPLGFDGPWFHGVILMHELGHAMGLGHVADPHEVMYGGRYPSPTVDDWGSGDVEGLRRVGAAGRCAA